MLIFRQKNLCIKMNTFAHVFTYTSILFFCQRFFEKMLLKVTVQSCIFLPAYSG